MRSRSPCLKALAWVGIATFDNSANDPFNPDPTKEVRWGPQNWDEMSGPFIGLIFDVKTPLETDPQEIRASLLRPVPGQAGPTLATVSMPGKN